MSRGQLSLLLVWAVAVFVAPAYAQQPADSIRTFCFQGKPMPHCQWFSLTEVGVAYLAYGAQPDPAFQETRRSVALTWNLGVMRNLTRRMAVGAALAFSGLDADESRAGVQVRYRQWLSPVAGLELAAGLLIEASDVDTHFHTAPELPGFTGELRVEWRDLFGANVRVDAVRAGQQHITDVWVGGRVGGGAGKVALAVLAVITLVGISTVNR